MKNTENAVIIHHASSQKLSQNTQYIHTIRDNNHHPITAVNNKDLIVSKKNNFLVILLKPNFSSITKVE